jgi:four helix bundle protein
MCQLELAQELGYITQNQLKELEDEYQTIAQMLSGLRKSKQTK